MIFSQLIKKEPIFWLLLRVDRNAYLNNGAILVRPFNHLGFGDELFA